LATIAWLYGPSAVGACSVETACRFMSSSLPHSGDDVQR
jgi:hypothetical protein